MSDIHIGQIVEIVAGIPTTFDKAGYETLFAGADAIAGVVEAPAFASSHTDIPIPNLGTGRTVTRKGANIGIASPLLFSTVDSDAGQAAVKAGCAARAEYSLSILNPGGTAITYCSGILKDFTPNKPTTTSYDGATATFVPNYDELPTTPPA